MLELHDAYRRYNNINNIHTKNALAPLLTMELREGEKAQKFSYTKKIIFLHSLFACDVKNLHKRHVKIFFFVLSLLSFRLESFSCIVVFVIKEKCLFKYFLSMNDSFALAENALRALFNFNNIALS